MSETGESIPEDVPVESLPIHHPQPAVPEILNERHAWDASPPNTPPPAYTPCTCGRYEDPQTLVNLGFRFELIHEIWNGWQLLKAQHPDLYQNMQPWMLLYAFLSFAFQVTRLPFAPPGHDPRRYNHSMVLYLSTWEVPSHWYITRQWDEAQRIASCAYAAAMWMARSLNMGCERCLGHPPPIYVGNMLDGHRFNELTRMAMAATLVI